MPRDMNQFLLEVATGNSIKASAQHSGVAVRSAYRYAHRSEFVATVSTLRRQMVNELRDRLVAASGLAIEKMVELLDSIDPRIALAAAKALLDTMTRAAV